MEHFTQIPIIEDPEKARCPCLLLLDVSFSMEGAPINQLNQGIKQFAVELSNDQLASKRVKVGIVTFGSHVRVHTDFVVARDFRPEQLDANGLTPLCQAVQTGIGLLDQRKAAYNKSGAAYYRPWIFLITDGAPTDADPQRWRKTVKMLKEGEQNKKFSFFALGVEGADQELLQQLSERQVLRLKGLKFAQFFQWLSSSLADVSRSSPGDEVPLRNPWGWATAPT